MRRIAWVLLLCVRVAAAEGPASQPASSAPATTSTPAMTRVELPGGGEYCFKTPPAYAKGDEAPLVICLHGTDERDDDTLDFWSQRGLLNAAVWAAPQGTGRGWVDTDVTRLRAMLKDLRSRVTFDANRVLLAGFSAGGAMTFHALYCDAFPATAAATLANYVPPPVTGEMIARQKHVPIFYGVGMVDINHDRMLAGLKLLRDNGAHVTVFRPYIGHRLSTEAAEQAITWFEQECQGMTMQRLADAEAAARDGRSGEAVALAEYVIAQKRWHAVRAVEAAESLLSTAGAAGRQKLAEAESLVQARRLPEAVALLAEVEHAYAGSSLAETARQRREPLEADESVRHARAAEQQRETNEAAREAFLDVQRLIVDRDFEGARRRCQFIMEAYPDTDYARRADRLLARLPRSNAR